MATSYGAPVICPVLIGREPLLAALRDATDRARAGAGQVVLISGEAGIGKSRLIKEALAPMVTAHALVIRAHCFEADRALPYAPLNEALHMLPVCRDPDALADALGPHATPLLALLPDLAATLPASSATLPADPEQQRHRLFHALARLFAHIAADTTMIFALEDLHWCDDATLQFLLYFARQIATQPFLLIATYRSGEVHPTLGHFLAELDRERRAIELALAPLTVAEIDAMLRAIFGLHRPVQRDFLQAIAALTDGNPFFIEEILKSLATSGESLFADILRDQASLQTLRIPRTVQDTVQRRVRQLHPATQRALVSAAVAGPRVDFALLQGLLDCDEQELLACIKELIGAQLIVEESADSFAFRHALTRQAIYAQLLARERRTLHRRIAELLEHRDSALTEPNPSELARHYFAAEVWEAALSHARRAGEQAQALAAPEAAIAQFTLALDAAAQLPSAQPAGLFRARGLAYETVGDTVRARADHEAALGISVAIADQRSVWQSLLDLGALWTGQDYDRAGDYFHRAAALARELGDPILEGQSLNRLGNWMLNTGRYDDSLAAHQQALALFETRADQQGTADTLDLLGMACAFSGNLSQSAAHYTRAIAEYRRLGDRRGLASSLGVRGLVRSPGFAETVGGAGGTLEESVADFDEATRLARQIGWPAGEAFVGVGAAVALAAFGAFGAAQRQAEATLRIATEIEHRQWQVGGSFDLGLVALTMGLPDRALSHLEQALEGARHIASAWWTDYSLACLARAHVLRRDVAHADAMLRDTPSVERLLARPPRDLATRRIAWARAELTLAQGDPARALQLVDALLASAPDATRPIPVLLALRGEALRALRQFDAAASTLVAAQEAATLLGARPLLWHIQRSLGQLWRDRRDESQAQAAYGAARTVIAALAETIEEADVRDAFLTTALGALPKEQPRAPGPRMGDTLGGLTAREYEVATLIAAGKTNREIAVQLFVGEGTVATHVKHILAKLALTSRTQVAAWALARDRTASG